MTFEDFVTSVQQDDQPPGSLNDGLRSLWLTRKKRWDAAHDVAQDMDTPMGAWIHAHLHRIEGDLGNAAYWYHRARQPVIRSQDGIEEEWEDIVRANLP